MEDHSPLVDYVPYPRKSALTFGLEIEFALATIPKSSINPEPQLGGRISGIPDLAPVQEALRKKLEDVGIPARVIGENVYPPPEYNKWTIKHDGTIRAPEDNVRYSWHKVELCSPSFFFTPGSLEQVRTVLEILSKNYRISCNRSCGLHVHVGNGLRGLSSRTIRNLMTTICKY